MPRYPLNTVVNFRPCGECQACCTVVGVVELEKQEYTRCHHQCDRGCAVYQYRPATCRGYSCLYQSGLLPGDDRRRPDNLGIVFDIREDDNGRSIQAWEVWPGAMREQNVIYLLNQLAEHCPVIVRLYKQPGYTIDRKQERAMAWTKNTT